MAVLFQQIDRRTKLGVLLLDVLMTEQVSFESQVTAYPVETGAEISDHITEGGKRLRVSGMIATADATGGWGMLSQWGFGSEMRSGRNNEMKLVDVIESLESMYKARKLVTISTGQMIYEDMAFTNLTAERASGGGQGNWLNITAELIKINKVNLKTADVPPPENVRSDVSGRAGETNKPAGKSTAGGSSSRTATQGATENQRQSLLHGMRNNNPNTVPGFLGKSVGVNIHP